MKSLSASIIVLCGTVLLIAGAYHRHGGTGWFLTAAGCVVGVIGLIGWIIAGNGRDTAKGDQRKL